MKDARILVIILVFLLVAPLVSADGMPLPRSLEGTVRETHQLVAASLSQESADVHLFISIESNKEDAVIVAIPFRKKPISFTAERTNLSEFKEFTHLNEVEKQVAEDERHSSQASDVGNRIALSYAALAFAPLAPLGLFAVFLGFGFLESIGTFGAGAGGKFIPADERRFYEWGWLEVYGVTQQNIDDIITAYNLDPALKTRYKEYGKMWLYVLSIKPVYKPKGLYDVLQEECREPKKALELLARKQKITQSDWSRTGCRIPLTGSRYYASSKCVAQNKSVFECPEAYSVEAFKESLKDASGMDVHFVSEYEDGEFWYPLGTGQFWNEPISYTAVYAFIPKELELASSGLKKKTSYGSRDVYVKEFFAENPDYDLRMRVQPKLFSYATELLKGSASFLLDAFALLAYAISFIASVLVGGFLLKKEKAKRGGKQENVFKKSFFLWCLYFFGSVAVVVAAAIAAVGTVMAFTAAGAAAGETARNIFTLVGILAAALVFLAIWIGGWFLIQKTGLRKLSTSWPEYAGFLLKSLAVSLVFAISFWVCFQLLTAFYYWV